VQVSVVHNGTVYSTVTFWNGMKVSVIFLSTLRSNRKSPGLMFVQFEIPWNDSKYTRPEWMSCQIFYVVKISYVS